jgi:AbrB family looped-hinge helix DNA binding protein
MTATLTSKGQVTVPVEIRRKLHLAAGARLEFILRDDRVELIPLVSSVRSLKGALPRPARPLSLTDMKKAVAEGAAR